MSALLRPAVREQRWTIVPQSTPTVSRHCAGCNVRRPFASSDRFRVNANGRRLDVWLIYRCTTCERTWNRALYERVNVANIGVSIDALSSNDRALAWRYAFGIDDLAAIGARADTDVPFRVDRDDAPLALPLRVRFVVPYPCAPRLDRVLAHELCISRSAVRSRARAGRIDAPPKILRKPVTEDLVVNLLP